MLAISWSIKCAVGIPIFIDGGTGFGEPMHVARFLSDCARMGIDGVFIEDQIFPKRAHYLNTYQEHTISTEEFVDKIRWARKGAGDSVFLLARTDTFATESAEVAISRANAALAAGADAVLAFPNNEAEALEFPSKVEGPVIYNNLWGNRAGRPILTQSQAKSSGYCMLWDGHPLLFAAYEGMAQLLKGYAEFGACHMDEQQAIETRKRIEAVMDFAALWEIERATVEKGTPGAL